MKRLFAVLLIALMVFSLCACAKNGDNTDVATTTSDKTSTKEDNTGKYEIEWGKLADDRLVGAWKPVGEEANDYTVLFTAEKTVRVIDGTTYVEADVDYGVDGAGNVSVCVFGTYLYDTWTFEIKDNILTINRPIVDENDKVEGYDTFTFEATNNEKYTLLADKDFTPVDELVGTWVNSVTLESYLFTEDGYAVVKVEDIVETPYGDKTELTVIEATYEATEDSVTLKFKNNKGEDVTDTLGYEIDGTEIIFEGSVKAYLNGEGDPNSVENATDGQ